MFGADMVGVEKRVVLESEIGRWIAARRSALCLICSVSKQAGGLHTVCCRERPCVNCSTKLSSQIDSHQMTPEDKDRSRE
jgi:hypothetical protein